MSYHQRVPERFDLKAPRENLAETFEARCRELGLEVHQGSLRKYQGCTHWHLTMPKQKGTLEATWWPKKGQFWLDMRSNRKSDWMPEIIEALVAEFA